MMFRWAPKGEARKQWSLYLTFRWLQKGLLYSCIRAMCHGLLGGWKYVGRLSRHFIND
jgi:hypothetical protein